MKSFSLLLTLNAEPTIKQPRGAARKRLATFLQQSPKKRHAQAKLALARVIMFLSYVHTDVGPALTLLCGFVIDVQM